MKRLLPLWLILSFISTYAQQKRSLSPIPNSIADASYTVGCSLFTNPNNYTTGSSFSYSAPVNNNSYLVGPGGARYGCLGSVPNQAWFVITVNTGGNLYFNISNTYGYDVDAAIWGPIANNDMANACAATQDSPLTCDYDTGRPDLYINNAQAGQKYVMLVANFSNANTTINVSQPSGGSVTYAMVNLPNCSMLPTANISGTSTTINEGQAANLTLSFTGSGPWNYTLSDGTIGTANTSPINVSVYPTASQTYTINSVSNLCGTSSGTGSVGVSVNRNIAMQSCFPLDGNISDSKGINTGSLQNGVATTTNRNNEANKALQFDGINDYVSLSANQLNNNTFAFAVWVKLDALPTTTNTEQVILSLGGTSDEHYLGVEYYNGAASWKFASNDAKVYSTATVNTGWHLLTGVRTGGQLKIYVDGVLTGTSNVAGASTFSSPLIGRVGGSIANTKFFKGKVDDIKFFKNSLIEPEILLLQNNTNCNDIFLDTYISVQSISTSLICTTVPFTVRGITNNLTIEHDIPFVAELSDASGSFANPTVIGSSNFLPLTVSVPNIVSGGAHKLRIRYGSVVSVNSFDVYINKSSTYNVTGTTAINDGQSTNVSLNFTGTGPWNYVLSTGLSGVATTSPWVMPVTPDQNTTYAVTSAQNVCGNSLLNGNNNATVTVNFTKQNITCLPFSGNATDQKGNNTTTVNGTLLTENRYGQINSAYAFNGTSDYIEYTTNLLRKREYTMSAWVLANNISGGTQYIISQGETGTNTFQGLALTSWGWQFISYSNNGSYSATSTTGWTANQWVHLTAVRTYQQLKLYVNGNLVSVANSADNIPFKVSDIGRIGANSSYLGNYFNGKIDDVRLYKGALNDEEVFALFANTGNCPTIENSSIILVKTLSPTTVCAGNNVTVSYTTSNIAPTSGSPFIVQLSDQNGSFTSPTVIGNGTSSPISATIPSNIPNGSLYRIRIVSSGASPVTSVTTALLNVSGARPTATISGGGTINYGASANLSINFTGTAPWTYSINNQTSQTTSTNPLTIPVSPTSTTTYALTSVSNTCGSGTVTGSAVVTVNPYIMLGSLSSTAYCQGHVFSVPFTANFTPVSNYKVELSDVNGSFTSPTTIGTGTSSPISVTMPNNATEGTAYKIRVVTTSPAYSSAGSINLTIIPKPTASISGSTTINVGETANLTLTFTSRGPWNYRINNGITQNTSTNSLIIPVAPTTTTTYTVTSVSNGCGSGTTIGSAIITVNPKIVLGNLNTNIYCQGQTFTIPFTANYTPSPNFKVELSDGTGSFTNPTTIGTGTSSPISVTIPNTASGDTTYKIRIVTVSPAYTSPEFTNLKVMEKPTAAISGTATINLGQSTNLTVTFTGKSPWNYRINNGTNQVTNTNPLIIPVSPTTTTTYTVTAISNVCESGTAIGSAVVTVNPNIALGTLNSSTYCEGQTFTIPFTANYTPASGFKVELSDAAGSFTSPTSIGTGTSSPVSVTIPNATPVGTNYKIRIVSTLPAYTSPEFTGLTILAKPTATISGTATIKKDKSTNLTLTFTSNAPWTYKINGGTSQTTSTSPLVISVSPEITTTYNVTLVSNACGSGTTSGSAVITVSNDPYLVSCYMFNGDVNDGHGNNQGIKGSAVSFTTDRFNNPNSALLLNGDYHNSFVEIALDELINTSAYTFSLWFTGQYAYLEGINVFTVMPKQLAGDYSTWDTKSQAITIRNESSGSKGILHYGTVCGINVCHHPFGSVNDTLTRNAWYHIVVTRENNVVKMYRNGALLNTITVSTGNSGLGGNLKLKGYIGKQLLINSGGFPYIGKFDDLQIYRRALNQLQIESLYNQTNQTSCKDVTEVPLFIETLSSNSVCKGSNFTIQYKSKDTITPINVQLSDANGSFANPIQIGSGNTSPITAQIPANQLSGTGYKVRLVSSDNSPVISLNYPSITVTELSTATISGTRVINTGESTNLTIAFTGNGPWAYTLNGGTSQSATTSPITISVTPATTTTYTVTSVSNACGNGTSSGNALITVSSGPYLISCYSFNGNINDSYGNGHGIKGPNASFSTDRFNNANGALLLNGYNSYAEVPLDELVNTSAYTLSLWFTGQYATIDGVNLLTIMPKVADDDFYSWVDKSQQISIMAPDGYMTKGVLNYATVCSNNNNRCFQPFGSVNDTLTLNAWYHIVVTRENNVVKLYRNGALLNTITVSSKNSNLGKLRGYIGSDLSFFGVGYPFIGKVDDIQVYRKAISSGQVRALYKNNKNACFDAAKFTCLADVEYSTILNGKQVLSVKNQIIGKSTIQAGSDIYFDAKNSILLQPGFRTEANTTFTAKPGEGCVD